jgi:hypothetical protein
MGITNEMVQRFFKYKFPAFILFDENLQSDRVSNFFKAVYNMEYDHLYYKSDLGQPLDITMANLCGVSKDDIPTLRVLKFA